MTASTPFVFPPGGVSAPGGGCTPCPILLDVNPLEREQLLSSL